MDLNVDPKPMQRADAQAVALPYIERVMDSSFLYSIGESHGSPHSFSVEAKKAEPTLAGQKVFLDSSFLLFMFQFYLQTQPSNSLCSFP